MLVTRRWREIREVMALPRVAVNLMHGATAGNDPFFARMVLDHYRAARRRRARHLFLQQMAHGVSLCHLPPTFDEYYMRIDGSARRNHKKSLREGCEVRQIAYNDYLTEIGEIWTSTDVRQGREMPEAYRKGLVTPTANPPSRSPCHDYPYFGVFQKGKLIGYAGCLVAGEYCGIESSFGHADFLSLGVVPLLFVGIAQHLYANHPQVKFYCYGMHFGASETLRRFKTKFGFNPHRVEWLLGADASPPHSIPPLESPRP